MTTSAPAVRYDGSACLNVRSVTMACETLRADSSAEPIRWAELSNTLWFVETCVTARNLYFDGTVPKKTTAEALEQIELLKRANDIRGFDVAPILFDEPSKILTAAKNAAAESRLLLENLEIDRSVDKALPIPEHEKFVSQLELSRSLSGRDRSDLLIEWVSDAFRGSKCLAAIVANGDELINSVLNAYARNAGAGPSVTAALINRFRLNYLNELAGSCKSAYVPDPTFEVLTREHVRLFKDYLLTRIVKQMPSSADEHNLLVENMSAEAPLPPIGLYALMATRTKKRPGAILETAYNEFRSDDSLMKLIWRNTRGGMDLQRTAAAEADGYDEIDNYFYDHFKALEKGAAGIPPKRTARFYWTPAILKGIASAIPAALGVGWLWTMLYSIARETATEVTIPFVTDRLLANGCDSYISEYNSLKWDFQNDDSVKQPLSKLASQVENVFGRPLAVT
jgi:hypothetical protein